MARASDPGASRWMRIVLALSLALNLLILGLVLGATLSPHHGWDRGGRVAGTDVGRDVGLGPVVAALSAEDRRAVRDSLRGADGPLGRNREELRRRFEDFLATVRAEPFDRARAAGLLAAQRRTAVQRQGIGEAALLDRLAAMSATDRAAFADRLDRSLRRGPSR